MKIKMVMYDEFGPEKILEVYDPKVGMRGIVVIDSLNLGPAKGGIRMTPTVTKEEVFRLARVMTWKNALAGLPFGGGKAGIIANPKEFDVKKKEAIVKAFSKAVKVISPEEYVAAPDINMGETEMEWYYLANGSKKSVTGKPKKFGGLPHELGSTGFGVYHSLLVAANFCKLDIRKAGIAVEGFGNVGLFFSKFLSEKYNNLVAVSDSGGVIYNKDGLDFEKLVQVKKRKKTVVAYRPGEVLPSKKILDVKADVLVTAAIPDLIKVGDVDRLNFKIIVEGSNIAMTSEVEDFIYKKGILVVPDFVANAGGVIGSYVEYIGGKDDEMFDMIKKKVRENTINVLELAKKKKVKPRDAAIEIAKARVRSKK